MLLINQINFGNGQNTVTACALNFVENFLGRFVLLLVLYSPFLAQRSCDIIYGKYFLWARGSESFSFISFAKINGHDQQSTEVTINSTPQSSVIYSNGTIITFRTKVLHVRFVLHECDFSFVWDLLRKPYWKTLRTSNFQKAIILMPRETSQTILTRHSHLPLIRFTIYRNINPFREKLFKIMKKENLEIMENLEAPSN